jgi:hypothetical protein
MRLAFFRKLIEPMVNVRIVQDSLMRMSVRGHEVNRKFYECFIESMKSLGHEIDYATVIDRRYKVGSRARRRRAGACDNDPR